MYTKIEKGSVQDLTYLNEFSDNINYKLNNLLSILYQGKQKINIPTTLQQTKNLDNYFYVFSDTLPEKSITIFDDIVYLNHEKEKIKFPIFYPSNYLIGYIPIDLQTFDEFFWEITDVELNDDINIRNDIQEFLIDKDVFIKDSLYCDSSDFTFDKQIHYINKHLSKPTFVLDGYKLIPQVYDVTHDVGYIIINNIIIQVFTKKDNTDYLGVINQFTIDMYSDFGDIYRLQNVFIPVWNIIYSNFDTELSDLQQEVFYNLMTSIIENRMNVFKIFLFYNKYNLSNLYEDIFSQFKKFYSMDIILNEISNYLSFSISDEELYNILDRYDYHDILKIILENIIVTFMKNFNSLLDESILQNLQIFLSSIDTEIVSSLFDGKFTELFNQLIDIQITYGMDKEQIQFEISSKILSDDKFQSDLDEFSQFVETYTPDYTILNSLDVTLKEDSLESLHNEIIKNFPFFNLIDLNSLDTNNQILLQILNQLYIRNTNRLDYDSLKEMFDSQSYIFYKNNYQTQKIERETEKQFVIIDLIPNISIHQKKIQNQFWFTQSNNKIDLQTLNNNINNLESILELNELSNLFNSLNIRKLQFMNINLENGNIIPIRKLYKLIDLNQNVISSKQYQYKLTFMSPEQQSTEFLNKYLHRVEITNDIMKILNELIVLESYKRVKYNRKGIIKVIKENEKIMYDVNKEIIDSIIDFGNYYMINDTRFQKEIIKKQNIYKFSIMYNDLVIDIILDTNPIFIVDNFVFYYYNSQVKEIFVKNIIDSPFKLPKLTINVFNEGVPYGYPSEIKQETLDKINSIVNVDKNVLSNLCIKDLSNVLNSIKEYYPISDDLVNNILNNKITINDSLMNDLESLIKDKLFGNLSSVSSSLLREKIKSLLKPPLLNELIDLMSNMGYSIDEILNQLVKYVSMLDKTLNVQDNLEVDINNVSDNMLDILVNTSKGCIS